MPEHSPAQKQYLLRVRRKKYMIHVSRILLFLGFLFLWEVSARRRWIDSFIFSSPSEIWQTFFSGLAQQFFCGAVRSFRGSWSLTSSS